MRRWLLVATLVVVPVALLVVFRTYPRTDLQWFSPGWHLVAVSVIAACALRGGAGGAGDGGSLRASRTSSGSASAASPSASACSATGSRRPACSVTRYNQWVGRLPYLAMCVFAVCLFAAGRSPSWGPNRFISRHPHAVDRRADAHHRGTGHDRERPADGTQWRNGVHVGRERVRRRRHPHRGPAGVRGAHPLAALASRPRRVPVRDRAGGDGVDRRDRRLRARPVRACLVVGLPRLPAGRLRRRGLRGVPPARRRALAHRGAEQRVRRRSRSSTSCPAIPRRCGRSCGRSRSRTPTPTATASARRAWRSSSGCRWGWRPITCA